ncbi:MAG: TIGR03986 family CRISPR-associated RAMP protein [Chloroflexi bacterium]|nr:TIGR03986 family CRISPR-associated RAMP protein [Chloroflexota bacterium]
MAQSWWKMTNEPALTFRAVAAGRDDPLRGPYEQALGKFGRNVLAGYLTQRSNGWFIQPALKPTVGTDSYLKVIDRQIRSEDIPELKRFNDPHYRPQYHEVSFDVENRVGRHGPYPFVSRIGRPEKHHSQRGVLICTGNMRETGDMTQLSPRRNYALVLQRDAQAAPLTIPEQVVRDYLAALTPFQKEAPFSDRWGCLRDGRPVFYIKRDGEVIAFGHTPNFRVPARIPGIDRAVVPQDLVPDGLRKETMIDLGEAIFGYVAGQTRKTNRAGRVYFADAVSSPGQGNVWLSTVAIVPRVLSGPKPTTFQHYLVQDARKSHDPDTRQQLAHYGTVSPGETVIRGHKLYWHQDGVGLSSIQEQNPVYWETDTQHTQIKPVRAGVTFRFRVYFENLHDFELGALLWALMLPGKPGKEYRHKLGMGKPLGLGAVRISPSLFLSDRIDRYCRIFSDGTWHRAEREEQNPQAFLVAFENYILNRMNQDERAGVLSLSQVPRIQMLLKLLEWPGPSGDQTRYMQIEGPNGNEYRERPVLPDPLNVHVVAAPPNSRRIDPRSRRPNAGDRGKGNWGRAR